MPNKRITFEFGATAESNAFLKRNPRFVISFQRLMQLTNLCFGREYRLRNRVDDLCFNLGETCRQDFLEILFLAANGYGVGAQKALRGLFERAVAIEYIRMNPDRAERFVRFAAIQEHRAAAAANDLMSVQQFDAVMTVMGPEYSFAKMKERYEQMKAEFQITNCRKCKTKRLAPSWDIDVAAMTKAVGEPYKTLYLGSYAMANFHVHATLASAYPDESTMETPEETNIRTAELALMNGTLVFIAVLRSQDEIFSLSLADDIQQAYKEVEHVWADRPRGGDAGVQAPQP